MIKHYLTELTDISGSDLASASPVILPFRLVSGDSFVDGNLNTYEVDNCTIVMYESEVVILCHLIKL